VAVITGAGTGMGRAGAILFAKEGAKVVVADIDIKAGEETVRMVKEVGGEAMFVEADISKTNHVQSMIKTTVDTYGKLDILYNNAAVPEPTLAFTADCTEENWDRVQSINLRGNWLAMKYAIPEMLKAGGGSIINVASQAATRGNPGITAYTASKGGLLALSRNTAIEYADKNIRVNVLEPGYISTPLISEFMKDPEFSRKVIEGTPQRRLGNPEEVAYAALFFASDESSHITGAELAVDGGITAWSHTM
jgi:NAD(P)-dependent dehydrogenase (short-subunit alcohol dehydrogenase family)